jgi:hypothetical protein
MLVMGMAPTALDVTKELLLVESCSRIYLQWNHSVVEDTPSDYGERCYGPESVEGGA